MRLKLSYLYSALAVIFAAAFGVVVGPHWVDDAVALAILAFAVIMAYLALSQEAQTFSSWWGPAPRLQRTAATDSRPPSVLGGNRQVHRSIIARFVRLSRIRFASSMALDSYNAFEQELLGRKGWQKLSAEELKEIIKASSAEQRS